MIRNWLAQAARWRWPPAPLLGIDIGASAIKLVELDRRNGVWALRCCADEALDPDWTRDGQIDDEQAVAGALRRLLKKTGTRTRQAALALPDGAVISKKIYLPAGLSGDALAEQVEYEAAHHLPFPLSEVGLDFCPLGPAAERPGQCEILLVAARNEHVLRRQRLAQLADLDPVVLDVESWAGLRVLALYDPSVMGPSSGPAVLIDMGARHSSIYGYWAGERVHERELAICGDTLTEQIAQHYDIAWAEAETRKVAQTLPTDYVGAVLTPFLVSVGEHLARAVQVLLASTHHPQVGAVFLAGGSAALLGLQAQVATHLNCACQQLDPWRVLGGAPTAAPTATTTLARWPASAYGVAAGLAMRRWVA